jgi:hypothetical protein
MQAALALTPSQDPSGHDDAATARAYQAALNAEAEEEDWEAEKAEAGGGGSRWEAQEQQEVGTPRVGFRGVSGEGGPGAAGGRYATCGVSGRSLTRPFRDAHRFPSTRW